MSTPLNFFITANIKSTIRARNSTLFGPPSAVDCTGDIHPGIMEPTPDILVENTLIKVGINNFKQIGMHKIPTGTIKTIIHDLGKKMKAFSKKDSNIVRI